PTQEEFESVAQELELSPRVIEGAIKPQQRPKLVRYGDSLFVVLKTARYLDEPEKVEFSEVHVLVGKDFIVTVRYEEIPALEEVRRRLEGEPESLRQGPQPILREIMDQIVDDYEPVLEGLGTDIQEVEVEVFGGNADVSQRIYELSRELVQFQRATSPLARTLDRVAESDEHDIDPELRSYLRELHDRVLRVEEPTEGFRDMLSDILVVNLTLIGVRQNDQTKKISAWAAILIVPTLITGIYGMNFDFMPELHWTFGYPLALALMVSISVGLYAIFRHVRWL
ncbi:MAG TPA: magnesium/cobalt transporter CorA, partial [Rubrobacter sp.]|nr:magnesium/cobalt transporter CorA [Rubrobacter sp.]